MPLGYNVTHAAFQSTVSGTIPVTTYYGSAPLFSIEKLSSTSARITFSPMVDFLDSVVYLTVNYQTLDVDADQDMPVLSVQATDSSQPIFLVGTDRHTGSSSITQRQVMVICNTYSYDITFPVPAADRYIIIDASYTGYIEQ